MMRLPTCVEAHPIRVFVSFFSLLSCLHSFVSKSNLNNLLWFHCRGKIWILESICAYCAGNVHVTGKPYFSMARKMNKNLQVGIFDWNQIMNDGWMIGCVKWSARYYILARSCLIYLTAWCANTASPEFTWSFAMEKKASEAELIEPNRTSSRNVSVLLKAVAKLFQKGSSPNGAFEFFVEMRAMIF